MATKFDPENKPKHADWLKRHGVVACMRTPYGYLLQTEEQQAASRAQVERERKQREAESEARSRSYESAG